MEVRDEVGYREASSPEKRQMSPMSDIQVLGIHSIDLPNSVNLGLVIFGWAGFWAPRLRLSKLGWLLASKLCGFRQLVDWLKQVFF